VSLDDEELRWFLYVYLADFGLSYKRKILVSGDKNLVMTNRLND
jgi:hypothetical protein